MRIYFVRHGESEANLLNEFSNRGLKHGLTERGIRQATRLASALTDAGITRLFSSPLLRAVQTAELLSATLGLSCPVTDALREYDCGILEGRSETAAWNLYDKVLHDWLHHGRHECRIEGGESFLDMQARFVPFITGLVHDHRDFKERILLVGHGGLLRCMLPVVLSNVETEWVMTHPIQHTAPIVAEARSEGLVCLRWGDVEMTSIQQRTTL